LELELWLGLELELELELWLGLRSLCDLLLRWRGMAGLPG
jgi:hypothetical protein